MEKMARIHILAEAYSLRPSSLFQFETEYGAFMFDEACLVAGRAAEKAAVENNSPRSAFGAQNFGRDGKKRFMSLRSQATRKVQVRNGVW